MMRGGLRKERLVAITINLVKVINQGAFCLLEISWDLCGKEGEEEQVNEEEI